MLKLLLVDDEEVFRESLKKSIDWESLGIRLCGEAENGEKALELLESLGPDIVLADINMPRINGLEFIQRAKEISEEIKMIIISGYDKFEYVKRAIELGVSSYILKPINEEELTDILKKISADIMDEKQLLCERIRTDEELRKNQKVARRYYLQRILFQNDKEGSSHQNEQESIFKWENEFTVFTVRCGQKENAFLKHMMECSDGMPEDLFQVDILEDDKRNLIFIVTGIDEEDPHRTVRDFIAKCEHQLKEQGLFHFSFGIGSTYHDYTGIASSYQESLKVLPFDLSGSYCVTGEYSGKEDEVYTRVLIREEHKMHIKSYLEQSNYSMLGRVIEELFQVLCYENFPVDFVRIFSIELLFPCAEKRFRTKSNMWEELFQNGLFENLESIETYTDLKKYILDIYREECNGTKSEKAELPEKIKDVVSYIETHYGDEDLSVGEISKAFFLNYNYLCVLFKKHLGMTINDFIFEIRMQRALSYANRKNMTVQEISGKVGFSNVNYFSKCFKKKFGIPPREYMTNIV